MTDRSSFSRIGPYAVSALVAAVAWGVGGYEPWAGLVLELGALALFGWLVAGVLLRTSGDQRLRHVSLARSLKRGSADVEILAPSPSGGEPAPLAGSETFYWLGYPFRRNGAGWLIALTTLWIGFSLLPLPGAVLSFLSPKAFGLRGEVATLVGHGGYSPWSVTPFLSFQDALLWLAYVMLFLATHQLASSSRAARRLTVCLLVLGIASGLFGLGQWLSALGGSAGAGAAANLEALRATGSFGNRNHYAFFQEMLFLVGLGWVYSRWREAPRNADRVSAQEARARTSLLGLGVAVIGLSLVFSLSRSGITFTLAGCGLFLYLTRRGRRPLLALAAALAAVALWIGVDPVISRFQLIPEELSAEAGRTTVWRDSLGALEDFWLTGSGLRSFQYVYPIYRSFGGRRFYSWAHNDYLQLGIELGVPGLVLVLAFLVWAFRRGRAVRRKLLDAGSSLRPLHAGYCAAAVAAGLHSFTDFGLHLPANAALFTVVVALVTGMAASRSRRSPEPVPARHRRLRRSPPVV